MSSDCGLLRNRKLQRVLYSAWLAYVNHVIYVYVSEWACYRPWCTPNPACLVFWFGGVRSHIDRSSGNSGLGKSFVVTTSQSGWIVHTFVRVGMVCMFNESRWVLDLIGLWGNVAAAERYARTRTVSLSLFSLSLCSFRYTYVKLWEFLYRRYFEENCWLTIDTETRVECITAEALLACGLFRPGMAKSCQSAGFSASNGFLPHLKSRDPTQFQINTPF